jgi:hypothetical protein
MPGIRRKDHDADREGPNLGWEIAGIVPPKLRRFNSHHAGGRLTIR